MKGLDIEHDDVTQILNDASLGCRQYAFGKSIAFMLPSKHVVMYH
jgi:hypothetical protein